MAELTFTRTLLGESQQRYEQAAALADDLAATASALRQAAAVAGCRMLGDDMYRLHRAAGEAARRVGGTVVAAPARCGGAGRWGVLVPVYIRADVGDIWAGVAAACHTVPRG
jgi:hypothetical protein